MTEPKTIIINASPLDGTGVMPLVRDTTLTTNNRGRLFTGSVSSGSRIDSSLFGLMSEDDVKSVSISATGWSPSDRVRVLVGGQLRTELPLRGDPQTVFFGAGETLAFVTAGNTVLRLVANELSESEHAALREPPRATRTRIRLTQTTGAGFNPVALANVTKTWDAGQQLYTGFVNGGSIPLSALDERMSRYDGVAVRVRISGFDGVAQVGNADAVNGDAFLEQEVAPSQWTRPITLGHDDRLAIRSPAVRQGASLICEIELTPTSADPCCTSSTAVVSDSGGVGSVQLGGVVPFGDWSDYSVNAAGARLSDEGWTLFTHAITGNAAGGFVGGGTGNKVVFGTDFALLDQPITSLTGFSLRFADRRPGTTSILRQPYINFVVDLGGSNYKIFVLDQDSNPVLKLLNSTTLSTVPEDQEFELTWVGGGRVKVVNEVAGVVPVENEGAGWLNKIFTLSDIIAQYPDARFVHAYPADNGLPKDLCLPASLLVVGDSNWTQYASVLVRQVKINGV